MKRFCGVQKEAWSTCRRKCSHHFLANQARFPHAANNGSALATEYQINGTLKLTVQAIGEITYSCSLSNQSFFSDAKMIHILP